MKEVQSRLRRGGGRYTAQSIRRKRALLEAGFREETAKLGGNTGTELPS